MNSRYSLYVGKDSLRSSGRKPISIASKESPGPEGIDSLCRILRMNPFVLLPSAEP